MNTGKMPVRAEMPRVRTEPERIRKMTREVIMEMSEIMEMSMDALAGYYSRFVCEGGETVG